MAPPGVNTFYDHFDVVSIRSNYLPSSLKSSSSSSSLSPGIAAIHSDHDYFTKPVLEEKVKDNLKEEEEEEEEEEDMTTGDNVEEEVDEMTTSDDISDNIDNAVDDDDSNTNGDAMLSSSSVHFGTTLGEEDDTDFLQDLDDLDLNLTDLDPCNDLTMEEMEDSFQDFIDSALDNSYTGFADDCLQQQQQAKQENNDVVIFNKDAFLNFIGLQRVNSRAKTNSDRHISSSSFSSSSSSSSSSFLPSSSTHSSSNECSTTTTYGYSSVSSSPVQNSNSGLIPTKKCLCSTSENTSSSVYSTAHSDTLNTVRTCPSTLDTTQKADISACTNCESNRLNSRDLMTPLYIDTSSPFDGHEGLQLEPLSQDCLDILMEDDSTADASKAEEEFLSWLHGGQQENSKQQHKERSDNNNNNICSSIGAESISEAVLASAETSINSHLTSAASDLEAFVDLEAYVRRTTSVSSSVNTRSSGQQKAEDIYCDHFVSSPESFSLDYQRRASTCEHTQVESQLRLSFLSESTDRAWESLASWPSKDVNSTNSEQEILMGSNFRSWPSMESVRSSSSIPSPSHKSDFPLTPMADDAIEQGSEKSHLALLNLFSDDNAPSLLHGDSAVPSLRFM